MTASVVTETKSVVNK